jgi:NADH-quinone oxidoreductase subunit L
VCSISAAAAGIAAAVHVYLKRPDRAAAAAERFPKLYTLLAGKYFVDEVYEAGIVRPIVKISETVLWKGVDEKIIDGTVDGTASLLSACADVLRKVQNGVAQFYAVLFIGGIAAILAWLLFRAY